jgi:hypothetical protein
VGLDNKLYSSLAPLLGPQIPFSTSNFNRQNLARQANQLMIGKNHQQNKTIS